MSYPSSWTSYGGDPTRILSLQSPTKSYDSIKQQIWYPRSSDSIKQQIWYLPSCQRCPSAVWFCVGREGERCEPNVTKGTRLRDPNWVRIKSTLDNSKQKKPVARLNDAFTRTFAIAQLFTSNSPMGHAPLKDYYQKLFSMDFGRVVEPFQGFQENEEGYDNQKKSVDKA